MVAMVVAVMAAAMVAVAMGAGTAVEAMVVAREALVAVMEVVAMEVGRGRPSRSRP